MGIRTGSALDHVYGYNKRLQVAIGYLGGKCVRCGSVEQLEFDHIDRSQKSFGISENICRRWEVVKQELDKCQLLCHPCHVEKTLSSDNIPTGGGWNKGKPLPELQRRMISDTNKLTRNKQPLTYEEWEVHEGRASGRSNLPPGRKRRSHTVSEYTKLLLAERQRESWKRRKSLA